LSAPSLLANWTWDVKVRIIYSNEPVFGSAFSIDGLLVEIELLSVLAGGKEEMEKKPRVFAGINMIRGVGMLDHGGAVSIEKMIYDNEVCGMIHRLINGITVTEDKTVSETDNEQKL
jgi:trimethylamine:corrinoid methyltransferase-like protein